LDRRLVRSVTEERDALLIARRQLAARAHGEGLHDRASGGGAGVAAGARGAVASWEPDIGGAAGLLRAQMLLARGRTRIDLRLRRGTDALSEARDLAFELRDLRLQGGHLIAKDDLIPLQCRGTRGGVQPATIDVAIRPMITRRGPRIRRGGISRRPRNDNGTPSD